MNLLNTARYIISFLQMLDNWRFEVLTVNNQLVIISFLRVLEIIFMTSLTKTAIKHILGLDDNVERG